MRSLLLILLIFIVSCNSAKDDKPNVVLFVVEYSSNGRIKKRTVFGTFLPDVDKGQKVRVHHSFAVEKIN